jgi:hypothetical protein
MEPPPPPPRSTDTRILAVLLLQRDAKQISIPEKKD